MDKALKEIRHKWGGGDFQNDVVAWEKWVADEYPSSDDVEEYAISYEKKTGSKFKTPLEELFNLPPNDQMINQISASRLPTAETAELMMETQAFVVFQPKGFGPFTKQDIPARTFLSNPALKGNTLVGNVTDENLFGNYESHTAQALYQMLKQRGLSLKRGSVQEYIDRLKAADAAHIGKEAEQVAELPPSEVHPTEGGAAQFEYDSGSDTDKDDTEKPKVKQHKGKKTNGKTTINRKQQRPSITKKQIPGATQVAAKDVIEEINGGEPAPPSKGARSKNHTSKKSTILALTEDPSYPAPVQISNVFFSVRK